MKLKEVEKKTRKAGNFKEKADLDINLELDLNTGMEKFELNMNTK